MQKRLNLTFLHKLEMLCHFLAHTIPYVPTTTQDITRFSQPPSTVGKLILESLDEDSVITIEQRLCLVQSFVSRLTEKFRDMFSYYYYFIFFIVGHGLEGRAV